MPCATPDSARPAAFEPRQDQVALRALDVAQHAEDVDLELLELGPLEDGPADADHAWPDFVDRHQRGRGRKRDPEDRAAAAAATAVRIFMSMWE